MFMQRCELFNSATIFFCSRVLEQPRDKKTYKSKVKANFTCFVVFYSLYLFLSPEILAFLLAWVFASARSLDDQLFMERALFVKTGGLS